MKTLICNVGETREPILAAMRAHAPEHVIFVCSADDDATTTRGSYAEVETANPSIPKSAGLADGTWEVVRVPADDPGAISTQIRDRLAKAAAEGVCIADYTAGTKSMSAALFMVACQTAGVQISLVTGPRHDLVRVHSGLEKIRIVSSAPIQRNRLETQVADCWSRFAYAEAAWIAASVPPEARDGTTDRWEALSRGFALWDAWDHAGAATLLTKFGKYTGAFLPTLKQLTAPPSRLSDANRVTDMFASTERRARGHQFDAAVLRLYRVFEWVAQWTLRWDLDIDTRDVPAESSIARLAYEAPTGKRVLACDTAWSAVAELPGPLQATARNLGNRVRELALKRNESVLAHGQRALGSDDYDSCRAALTFQVWPTFLSVAKVREVQLPAVLP